MKNSRMNNIGLIATTVAVCIAGTVLTLVNNLPDDSDDIKRIGLAIALAASFTACEVVLIWSHKAFEKIKQIAPRQMWRKAVLTFFSCVLGLSMAYALLHEVQSVLDKEADRGAVSNVGSLLDQMNTGASKKDQRRNNAEALKVVSATKTDTKAFPFVLCYGLAIVGSVLIVAVQPHAPSKQSTTRNATGSANGGGGDQIPANPQIEVAARQIGFVNPQATNVKAYLNTKRTGLNIYADGKYAGYLPMSAISQSQSQQNQGQI